MSVIEPRVLAIVRELVAELGGASRSPVVLDALLDRDLGLSSLERVELLLRLERAFGVHLPEAVLAGAMTPRDLVAAVAQAAPAVTAGVAPAPAAEPVAATRPAEDARTLVDALTWHAERTPDRVHIYLRDDDGRDHPITYGALYRKSMAAATGLRARGVSPRDTVILMLRTEEDFFTAFFGTLMAGAVPVPIYPPVRFDQLADYAKRQRGIVESAGSRVLITIEEAEQYATLIRGQVPSLEIITTVESLAAGGTAYAPSRGEPGEAALIQYTSGSTGNPKGVLLTHANLIANVRAIGQGLDVRPDDVCVSWLPLYHDMGLIGAWLTPLYYGNPVAIMSPLAFLSRPSRWLHAIHAHRGTVSPAPNFAYDLVVRKTTDDELQGLDLSSWRLALNGAEMVSPDTIAKFTERFSSYGFRPETMCPVYGLAEASVGLTMTPLGRQPRVDAVERAPFEARRELVPAGPHAVQPLRFVSCGRPLPGLEVRVVDAAGHLADDREEGRIEFRGASVTEGYYRNPEATAAAKRDGWMTSGDLGYWAGGDLFITGREKDVIIQGGRNVSAPEVEQVVSAVPGVRRGCVAAFGVHDPALGTERLVVVAETRERALDAQELLRQAIVGRLVQDLGVPPDVVVIAPPGAVLKTSSGKIRRAATRDAYRTGSLGRRDSKMQQARALVAGAASDWTRRAWRTTRDLAFTARLGSVLLLTAPVLWVALKLTRNRIGAIRITRRWARAVIALSGVRLEVDGLHHLNGLHGALIVANHASYIDPLVLMAAIPANLHFVAKLGLTRYPLLGLAITRADHVTVERGDLTRRLESAEDLVARLQSDDFIAVFPEGTFERRRGLLPFRLGAFKAAVETGRPIVPVAICGSREFLRDGERLFHKVPLRITVGQPLHSHGDGLSEIVRLRDEARRTIEAGTGEVTS